MTAETAFNVYSALSEIEKKRFLSMIAPAEVAAPEKAKKANFTDSHFREIILTKFRKWNLKRRV
jgi:hypothetical protein